MLNRILCPCPLSSREPRLMRRREECVGEGGRRTRGYCRGRSGRRIEARCLDKLVSVPLDFKYVEGGLTLVRVVRGGAIKARATT